MLKICSYIMKTYFLSCHKNIVLDFLYYSDKRVYMYIWYKQKKSIIDYIGLIGCCIQILLSEGVTYQHTHIELT